MAEATKRPLDSLPLHVLEGIVEALCPHCTEDPKFRVWETPLHSDSCHAIIANTHALASLAATCRALYAVANPFLYHQPQCPLDQHIGLLRTLVGRPDLARRVKVLRLDFGLRSKKVNTDDRTFTLDVATRRHGWSVDMHVHSHPDADTSAACEDEHLPSNLLLATCPNLGKLSMGLTYPFPCCSLVQPASLPHLKDIYLTDPDIELGTELERLTKLYRAAPALETLTSNVTDTIETNEVLPLGNLRHLRLQNSTMSPYGLRTLLRSCPKLESFSFQTGGGSFIGDRQFGHWMVRTLLLRYTPQLKHLDLRRPDDRVSEEWGDRGCEEDDDPIPAPGFASLSQLETLVVDVGLLEDFEEEHEWATQFPESLRSLTVTAPDPPMTFKFDALRKFADMARTYLPNITFIKIEEGLVGSKTEYTRTF
jgi:hypothetical protein